MDVKSLVTLALTATFIALAFRQVIGGDKFYDIFLMIITFYFGTQTAKKEKKEEEKEIEEDVSRD